MGQSYADLTPAVENQIAEMGYKMIMWDVDTLDWKRDSVDAILTSVREQVHDGAIILLHDGGSDDRSTTLLVLETLLAELGGQGYRFESVCP